jgi:hypothetical protein
MPFRPPPQDAILRGTETSRFWGTENVGEQIVSGQDNLQILVKESENVRIEINGTKVATLWMPPFRKAVMTGNGRDLALLLASTAVTQLVARDGLWDDKEKLSVASGHLPILGLVVGAGGRGLRDAVKAKCELTTVAELES